MAVGLVNVKERKKEREREKTHNYFGASQSRLISTLQLHT